MQFSFFTLFPQLITPYFEDSILKRARESGILKIESINFREFATNAYHKVDNPPVSGGAGQVLMFETLSHALWEARDSHIIFLSPCGKNFKQNDAIRLARKSHISFVCGRYEGFDERLIESFGDEGAQKGYCLYKMGCKGPYTFNNCSKLRFNQHTSWPIQAGHGCIGCSEPNFWDTMRPFEEPIGNKLYATSFDGLGADKTANNVGSVILGAAAVGIAAHAVISAIKKKQD